jgi:flagellar FliL protein
MNNTQTINKSSHSVVLLLCYEYNTQQEHENKEQNIQKSGVMIDVPTFTTNIADPLGRRFIKLHFVIEVSDTSVIDTLNKNNSRMRDSVIVLLSSKSYSDLTKKDSKERIRNEIMNILITITGVDSIKQLNITQFDIL